MISKTTSQLKHDLEEVKDKLENVGKENTFKDLKEAFEMLEEHLKDHIETIENFICDIN